MSDLPDSIWMLPPSSDEWGKLPAMVTTSDMAGAVEFARKSTTPTPRTIEAMAPQDQPQAIKAKLAIEATLQALRDAHVSEAAIRTAMREVTGR